MEGFRLGDFTIGQQEKLGRFRIWKYAIFSC